MANFSGDPILGDFGGPLKFATDGHLFVGDHLRMLPVVIKVLGTIRGSHRWSWVALQDGPKHFDDHRSQTSVVIRLWAILGDH